MGKCVSFLSPPLISHFFIHLSLLNQILGVFFGESERQGRDPNVRRCRMMGTSQIWAAPTLQELPVIHRCKYLNPVPSPLPLFSSLQMPWQIAPALVIISGAFTVTGGLLMGIQYAAFGKVYF